MEEPCRVEAASVGGMLVVERQRAVEVGLSYSRVGGDFNSSNTVGDRKGCR